MSSPHKQRYRNLASTSSNSTESDSGSGSGPPPAPPAPPTLTPKTKDDKEAWEKSGNFGMCDGYVVL